MSIEQILQENIHFINNLIYTDFMKFTKQHADNTLDKIIDLYINTIQNESIRDYIDKYLIDTFLNNDLPF